MDKMKVVILAIIIISLILLSGCQSSYDRCMNDCKYDIHDDICTDFTDIWDGCTDAEYKERDRVCFSECK